LKIPRTVFALGLLSDHVRSPALHDFSTISENIDSSLSTEGEITIL